MKQLLVIALIIVLGLVSCDKDDADPVFNPEDNEQTVFMYLPWSSDLTSYFYTNISDFEKVIKKDVLKKERLLIFMSTSATNAVMVELRYCKGDCVRDTLKTYTNPAFTTADGISSILDDVKSFAPAERYGMIIGCHGRGWLPVPSPYARGGGEKYHWEYEGVPLTRYFGGKSREYQTNTTTLAEGISQAGIKMEYILFDDCYMSSIEVAYDLKDVTDYLIASPTEIMAYGMPYAEIGEHLIGNVDYEAISQNFFTFYQYNADPYGTIAITVCSELEKLALVMKEINEKHTFNTALLNELQRMDGYTPVIFFDYGDYVSKLCTDPDLLAGFEIQFERTLPLKYRKHTEYYYSMGRGSVYINTYSGVTISDPSTNSETTSVKEETAWYKATH